MTKEQIQEQIRFIFNQVAPEINFESLDLTRPLTDQAEIDSYDFLNILSHIEQRLGVRVPDAVIRDLPHLEALITYIEANASASPKEI